MPLPPPPYTALRMITRQGALPYLFCPDNSHASTSSSIHCFEDDYKIRRPILPLLSWQLSCLYLLLHMLLWGWLQDKETYLTSSVLTTLMPLPPPPYTALRMITRQGDLSHLFCSDNSHASTSSSSIHCFEDDYKTRRPILPLLSWQLSCLYLLLHTLLWGWLQDKETYLTSSVLTTLMPLPPPPYAALRMITRQGDLSYLFCPDNSHASTSSSIHCFEDDYKTRRPILPLLFWQLSCLYLLLHTLLWGWLQDKKTHLTSSVLTTLMPLPPPPYTALRMITRQEDPSYLFCPDNSHASTASSIGCFEDDRHTILCTECFDFFRTSYWTISTWNNWHSCKQGGMWNQANFS